MKKAELIKENQYLKAEVKQQAIIINQLKRLFKMTIDQAKTEFEKI